MKPKNVVLTGNQLKILALLAMTCDHAGKEFFPDVMLLQIIGRLAYPVFAYMIAEGCRYTKNRKKYLSVIAGVAFLCQIIYAVAEKSVYQCILVTFSLSIILIYIIDNARKTESVKSRLCVLISLAGVVFLTEVLPQLSIKTDYAIDYGFFGVMLPVGVYYAEGKLKKLIASGVLLFILSAYIGGIQWFSLIAMIPLALYNGKRGKANIKNLFYVYYPAHLVVIHFIGRLIQICS